MNVNLLTDHQLLVAIAEVNAELGDERPATDAETWSIALNDEGARRWGDAEMDELAQLVTRAGMTGDEFVAWAREEGVAWLHAQRRI